MALKNGNLAIDLYCGLGGWTEGLLAEGWDVTGFDIERHQYGEHQYPAQLVLQDILTLHGSPFKDASLIVASPPCQFFSYTAMPWTRAKKLAADVRADPARLKNELALFDACFRIQREACEAAGRHIPLVVENVRGAQPWVGRARWKYGSFYLWGDVPALPLPVVPARRVMKAGVTHRSDDSTSFHGNKVPAETGVAGIKQGGDWFNNSQPSTLRCYSSKSSARKMASAMIAKIPQPLSRHVALSFKP